MFIQFFWETHGCQIVEREKGLFEFSVNEIESEILLRFEFELTTACSCLIKAFNFSGSHYKFD